MNLPRHRRSEGEKGQESHSPPLEMPPRIKIITTKPYYVFSVSVLLSIFAYNSIRVQKTNINIDDQVAWALSNQIVAIQFKRIGTVFMTKQKSPKQILQ